MGAAMKGTMYRLLIVDDEDDIRRGLAEFFPWGEIGFEVAGTAENGRQAFEIVEAGGVDVVLTDIRMPLMSGIELAKALSEAGLAVPVVFLSAYKDFSYARQALQYGVRDYVLKPTDYADIRTAFMKLRREMDRGRPATVRARGADRTAAGGDPFVSAIINYVERDCAKASLKGAARVVGMNPQYVSRLFRERTGENFHTLLARTRMEKAARLLRDGGYRAYEISAMVGYSNQKNFTRAFKQHFGAAPVAFRRQGSAQGGRER
jgi:two-component system response regulator YesN